MRTTDFGDDKDRVVIKSDGAPAYVAADIAYYLDKRERGFDLCIYMLGADHHGYIARLKAVAAALGDDPATVEVLIGQMVNLVRDGQPVRMSKRAGTVITLDDLVEAIGVDAARYSLIRSSVDTQIDIDLALWSVRVQRKPGLLRAIRARPAVRAGPQRRRARPHRRHRQPRPAHAREGRHADPQHRRVPARAEDRRVAARATPGVALPGGPRRRLPPVLRLVPRAATGRRRAQQLHTARLALCQATRQVIENGLGILGVTAPERM